MVKFDENNPNAEATFMQTTYDSTGLRIDVLYVKGKMLGKGGFARVYQATEQSTGRILACKVIPQSELQKPRQRKKLMAEVRIQQSLNHKNIVRFDRFFSDNDNAYILIEICNNRTVLDMLKHRGRLPEREVRYWISMLISAVQHMHANLVIHRDLKLGNMFINDMVLKVGDFGLATKLDYPEERKKTICGTPNYIAPEVLESPTGHSFEADIWSIGVILYTLLVGIPPFETKDVQKTYGLIKANAYSFPRDRPISANAKDVIRNILKTAPQERLTLAQILAHPFFSSEPIPSSLPVHALTTEPAIPVLSPSKSRLRYEHVPPSSPTKTVTTTTVATTKENDVQNVDQNEEPENNPNNHIQRLPHSPHHPHSPTKHKPNAAITPATAGNNIPAAPIRTAPNPPIVTQNNILMGSKLPLNGDRQEISALITAISSAISGNMNTAVVSSTSYTTRHPTLYLRKWADYSEKYGIGYFSSDNSVGAFFNDATKMFMSASGREIGYIDKSQLISFATPQQGSSHDLTHDVSKKVTLIKYFQGLFLPGFNGNSAQNAVSENYSALANKLPFFITHYYRTSSALLFRFSNGVLQVNFNDHVKVLVNPAWTQNPIRYLDASSSSLVEIDEKTDCLQPPTNSVTYIDYIYSFIKKLYNRNQQETAIACVPNSSTKQYQQQQQQQQTKVVPSVPATARTMHLIR